MIHLKIAPVWIALLFMSASCLSGEEVNPEPTTNAGTTYRIKAGEHSTTNPFKQFSKNRIRFEVKFDSSAVYQTLDPNNQADINKLYGMSDCRAQHQVSSARFGWRWYQNQLELHAYSYRNRQRQSTFVAAIPLNQWTTCELILTDQQYIYRVAGQQVEQPRGCSGTGVGYQLYPYFGGDETAPHDIRIQIRELP